MENIQEMLERERQLTVEAFLAGNSVHHIQQMVGYKHAEKVYRTLRDAGKIGIISTRHKYSIPDRLKSVFDRSKVSFPQWCNAWGFDLAKAEEAIKLGHWDATDPYSKKVLAAFKSDFHNVYHDLYEVGNMLDRKYKPIQEDKPRNGLRVEWLDEHGYYAAWSPQIADIFGYGKDWDEAIADYKKLLNVHRRLKILNNLVKDSKRNNL